MMNTFMKAFMSKRPMKTQCRHVIIAKHYGEMMKTRAHAHG